MNESKSSDASQQPVQFGMQQNEVGLKFHGSSPHENDLIDNNMEPSTSKINSMTMNGNPIVLTQLNGTGYCFNGDDYMKIRKDYRITGSFMGTNHLKGYVRKSHRLPVEFNEYETQLLIDENIAILVSKRKAFEKGPTEEVEKDLLNKLENRIIEQGRVLNEKKIQETMKNITRVMTGKRNKLIKSGIPEKDIKLSEEQVIQEMRSNMKFDRNNAQLEISNQCVYDHEAKIIKFQVKDTLGYKIYRDIWKQGKVYVTSGGNFGGNFLIYPGDPLVYHASHVVHVIQSPQIQPLDMIAKCRLAVNVNKICILAYLDLENIIRYQTVHWEGSKDKLNIVDFKLKNENSDEDKI